jgi:hypothetical protein
MKTQFSQLNLSSIEHVWVEYHVAESYDNSGHSIAKISSSGLHTV